MDSKERMKLTLDIIGFMMLGWWYEQGNMWTPLCWTEKDHWKQETYCIDKEK